jgi:hypothetical protein
LQKKRRQPQAWGLGVQGLQVYSTWFGDRHLDCRMG